MTIVMIIMFFSFLLLFRRNDGGQDGVGPGVPTLLPVQSFSQHGSFLFLKKEKQNALHAGKENYGKEERRIHSETRVFYPPA